MIQFTWHGHFCLCVEVVEEVLLLKILHINSNIRYQNLQEGGTRYCSKASLKKNFILERGGTSPHNTFPPVAYGGGVTFEKNYAVQKYLIKKLVVAQKYGENPNIRSAV